jgi:endonuclease YncB( thermonuclease family)
VIRHTGQYWHLLLGCVVVIAAAAVDARSMSSYVSVNDDASLNLRGHTIVLAGIHVPKTAEGCIDRAGAACRTRAAAALRFKIQGFVHCEGLQAVGRSALTGTCHVDRSPFDPGIDLGAYLVENGWAFATPDAPFSYHALQRLAEAQLKGIWGNSRVITNRGLR